MPFIVKPELRVKRKKLKRAVDRVGLLFTSMEEWAKADGNGPLAAYAREMQLHLAALYLSFDSRVPMSAGFRISSWPIFMPSLATF